MDYKYSPAGRAFTEREEGVIGYVYDDAVAPTRMWVKGQPVHGHLTAGVGHLLSASEISAWVGKPIPQSVVDQWFDRDNDSAERAVSQLVTINLTDNQAQVLLDFVFNNNYNAFANSTLLKRVNAGQFDRVPAELMRWTKTHIDGKLVDSPGLQKRAADRATFWHSPDLSPPSSHPVGAPSGTPMAVPTPKDTSPFEWASLGISGIGGLSGFSGVGGFFGIALGIVLIGGFCIGAAIIVKRSFFST